MAESMITVREVTRIFGPGPDRHRALELLGQGVDRDRIRAQTGCVVAVDRVSVDIARGELFVLMGLSGSGKSTLLRCLNGIIPLSGGEVAVDGRRLNLRDRAAMLALRRETMAMVFQHFGLLPHRTVLSNVAFGLEVQGVATAERLGRAETSLAQVGLKEWGQSMPHELSGGMQQRVGLARALCTGAPILLMDEPFSALDPLIRREMQDELLRLQRELNRTIVFVTHDLNEAMKIGDRIGIMRNGRLVQVGTTEDILSHPADDYVAQFVEDIDRSRALTAGNIARKVDPIPLSSGPRRAIREMRNAGLSSIFVVDAQGRLAGLVRAEAMADAARNQSTGIQDQLETAIPQVNADTSLAEVAKMVAEFRMPAAVTDPQSGRLTGIITWVDIVATIGGIASDDLSGSSEPIDHGIGPGETN